MKERGRVILFDFPHFNFHPSSVFLLHILEDFDIYIIIQEMSTSKIVLT